MNRINEFTPVFLTRARLFACLPSALVLFLASCSSDTTTPTPTSTSLAAPNLTTDANQRLTAGTAGTITFANSGGGTLISCTVSPNLSTGLSVSTTTNNGSCQITGTPPAVLAAKTYTVTATNTGGTDTATVELTIVAPAPNLTTDANQRLTAGTAGTITFANSGGALTGCTVSPALSTGLSVAITGDKSSCQISGTPAAALDAASYTVTATNDTGEDEATVSITVAPAPVPLAAPNLDNATNQSLTVNTPATITFANNGGGVLISCTVSPNLSTGLSVAITADKSSCQISGTPPAVLAAASYTVTATNATGVNTATVELAIILPVPNLANLSDQSFAVDTPRTITFANSGGGALISCTVSPALSTGLSVSPTADESSCQISGTPAAALTPILYTVTATNATGVDASLATVTITITASTLVPAPIASADTMIWSDEFDGTTLDLNNWDIQLGDGCPDLCGGWGNEELQLYTDSGDNIKVQNDMLNIIITKTSAPRKPLSFDSGRIRTAGRRTFLYPEGGTLRIEARMLLPGGGGIWPAFWMLPEDYVHGAWPQSGEVDIMEAANLGLNGRKITSFAAHYGFPWPNNSFGTNEVEHETNPATKFNVYAIEWEEGEIRWYINDEHVHTQTAEQWYSLSRRDGLHQILKDGAPFKQRFHLLINAAVGSNRTPFTREIQPNDIDVFPRTMQVDWVRVYTCGTDTINSKCFSDSSVSDNDISEEDSPNSGTNAEILQIPVFTDGLQTLTQTVGGQSRTATFAARTRGDAVVVDTSLMVDGDQVAQVTFSDFGSGVSFAAPAPAPATEANVVFDLNGGWFAGQLEFDLTVVEVADGSGIQARISDHNLGYLFRNYSAEDLNRIKNLPGGTEKQVLDLGLLSNSSGFSYQNVAEMLSLRAIGSFGESTQTVIQIDDIRMNIPCPIPRKENLDCRADITTRTAVPNLAGHHSSVTLGAVTDTVMYPTTQNVYIDSIDTDSGMRILGTNLASDDTSGGVVVSEVAVEERGMVINCAANINEAFCGLRAGPGAFAAWSAYTVIEFDIRILSAPDDNSTDMFFKYEADSQANADVVLGPVVSLAPDGAWRRVRIDLTDMVWRTGSGGQYNLGHVHRFFLFPSFGRASGAVWQMDNIVLYGP